MTEFMSSERFLNPEHFPEADRKILAAIEKVRGIGGEAYDGTTELARRNPVKPDTAPLLSAYTGMREPGQIFEMGTAYGFSALHLALGNHGSRILTVEFDPEVAATAQATLDEAGVDALVMPHSVQEVVASLAPETRFDMVVIDHDKASYLADFRALEPFLADGALVLADNVNDRRAECGDFVEYMQTHFNFCQIIPTQAGLLVAEYRR